MKIEPRMSEYTWKHNHQQQQHASFDINYIVAVAKIVSITNDRSLSLQAYKIG